MNRKLFSRTLAILLSILLLFSAVPMTAVMAASTALTEDFSDISDWEDAVGNYRQSPDPLSTIDNQYPTRVETLTTGETVLVPGKATSRAGVMLTPKNWYTGSRVETVSSTFKIPNTVAGNPDTCPGIYAVNIDGYTGLVLQVNNINSGNTAGKLNYQWLEFDYYDITEAAYSSVVWYSNKTYTGNNKANAVTSDTAAAPSNIYSIVKGRSTASNISASDWITVTLTYDYSDIENNKLTVNATFTQGTESATTSYPMNFDNTVYNWYEGTVTTESTLDTSSNKYVGSITDMTGLTVADTGAYNAYEEGFRVGIAQTNTKNSDVPFYFDNFNVQFAKSAEEFANEFKTTYADTLALNSVSTNAQAAAVFEAIKAYNGATDEVKALLASEKAKLDALHATIKITADDFETNILNEVWESIPDHDIETEGQTGKNSAQSAAATTVIDSADENNNVLLPEVRSVTRKRRMLTIKEEYLKDAPISSFTTDVRPGTVSESWDGTAGIYFAFKDKYNWARLEINKTQIRVMESTGTSDSDLANNLKVSQTTITNAAVGSWYNVKIDFTYTDSGITYTFTFTDKATKTQTVKEYTSSVFTSEDILFGYGASSSTYLVEFDNFAITYLDGSVEVDPAEEYRTAHADALALTVATVAIDDEAIVDAAIAAYGELADDVKAELTDEYALLTSLKAKLSNLEAKSGLFTEDFENGFDVWEVLNTKGGEVSGTDGNGNPVNDTYTDAEGGIVANPKVTDINGSANVLSADGVSGGTSHTAFNINTTIYKLKDSVLDGAGNLAVVSGKAYAKATGWRFGIITEYTDSNNYAGFLIDNPAKNAYGDFYTMSARAFKYVDGKGTQYASTSYAKSFVCESDILADWFYYAVEYTDTAVRFAVTDENGVYSEESYFEFAIGDKFGGETAVFTGENRVFALTGWNSAGNSIPYHDDLSFIFESSDYASAKGFISDNHEILTKKLATITNAENAKIEAMLSDYSELSDTAKQYLNLATTVSAIEAAKWGDDAAAEYTAKYSAIINSDITADNAADFEAAWTVFNRLTAAEKAELSELKATLINKLTAYSGTLNLTDKIRINVIGDSITYGFGLNGTTTVAWPAKLQTALGDNYEIVNCAISGYRVVGDYNTGAVQYLTRQYSDNGRLRGFDKDADIAIITLGINDAVHLASDTENRYAMLVEGYKTLINSFLATDTCSTVIVTGSLWDCDGNGDAYNPMVCKAAKEACDATGAYYTDLYSYLGNAIPGNEATYLLSDDLHYTEAGEQLIADYFVDYFENDLETVFRTENASYFDVFTQKIEGATIKNNSEGGQDIRFGASFGNIRTNKTVASYGVILTLETYITAGEISYDDITVENATDNKYFKMTESTAVENVVEGGTFTVNVGGVSPEMYGYRHVIRSFVKYTDGTIDYSDTTSRSVIGVAKSILTWVYGNYENIDTEYGVADYSGIFTAIDEDGNFTWVQGATDNNGEKILAYLEENGAVITNALNALN